MMILITDINLWTSVTDATGYSSASFNFNAGFNGDGKCKKKKKTEPEIDLKGVRCVKQHRMLSALQTPKHVS